MKNIIRLFPFLSLFGFMMNFGPSFMRPGLGGNNNEDENKNNPPPPDEPEKPEEPETGEAGASENEKEHFYAIRVEGRVSVRATDPKLAFQKLQTMFPEGMITRDNSTLVS